MRDLIKISTFKLGLYLTAAFVFNIWLTFYLSHAWEIGQGQPYHWYEAPFVLTEIILWWGLAIGAVACILIGAEDKDD